MTEDAKRNGLWFALYWRHFRSQSDVFDTEMEAVEFLHRQAEIGELGIIGVHGPNGEKWDKPRIDQHFQEIYEREHADEIAAAKAKAAADKEAHEKWLAKQPAWKRDRLKVIRADYADGYVKLEMDGVILPFMVREPAYEYDSEAGHVMTLRIPLDAAFLLHVPQKT